MIDFWELLQFELKKIFVKRSTLIILILTAITIIFSCCVAIIGYNYVDGKAVESKLEAVKTDMEYNRALSGRNIDSGLILEMSNAYAKVIPGEGYNNTEEYQLYARPYSSIYRMARVIYDREADRFEMTNAQTLTKQMAESLYAVRDEKIVNNINSSSVSDSTKKKLLQLNERVETPIVFSYAEGYIQFYEIMYTTGIISCFVAAILLSPIFAGEYSSRADQLILTSRFGKNKLITAKLFAGMTVSAGLSLVLTALTFISCMIIYGFDGSQAAIQNLTPVSVYPLKMGELAVICTICVLFANLLTSGITLLLSSKFKSPFGVVIISGVIIMAPMFVNPPDTNVLLNNLFCLLPANMTAIWNIISEIMFEFGRISIEPYIFMPLFGAGLSAVLLPFAYKAFKNHQI